MIKKLAILLICTVLLHPVFTVFGQDISQIVVKPDVDCIKLSETVTFTATAYDVNGTPLNGITFTWSIAGAGRIVSQQANSCLYAATTPGNVTITASAGGKSGSVSFSVGSPKVSQVTVRVDPEIAGEVATYYISFSTDECGMLQSGDEIYIAFPYGTIFPRSYVCSTLTVNGMPASYTSTTQDDTPILIVTVPNGFPLTTQFYLRICKVINPRGGACYMIAVATDKQPQWALSNSFAIRGGVITAPIVDVEPNVVGELAAYKIRFTTSSSGRMSSCYGGYIQVEFPFGTKVPAEIDKEDVLINGMYCTSTDPIVNGRTVKLFPGMSILDESEVTVLFTLEAGIQNPDTPGDYELTIWTSSDSVHVDSRPYKINSSVITDVEVTVDKPYINTVSAYTIRFVTGLVGRMKINGIVTIYFPTSVKLPATSRPGDIKVNDTPTSKSAIIEGNYTLKIPIPVDIEAKSLVVIEISEAFGIVNPPDPRKYKLEVHTAKEGTNVESNEFLISPSVIGDLSVSIKTPYIGLVSQLDLTFKTGGGGRLTKDKDQIKIVLPKGAYLPNAINREWIEIQGLPINITPFIKKAENEIWLHPPVDISSNEIVRVRFLEEAGIQNPKIPGDVYFQVATTREVSYIKSPLIRISESTIHSITVISSQNAVSEITALEISFTLGEAGNLTPKDKLYLSLDSGYQFPDEYQQGIWMNGESLDILKIRLDYDKKLIEISLDKDYSSLSRFFIQITTTSQFRNPEKDGSVVIGVSSTREPRNIVSPSYQIIPLPMTDIQIQPTVPDGKANFYISEPTITFQTKSSDTHRVKTYYKLNDGEWREYIQAIRLGSGEYLLAYYSAYSDSAKESVHTYQFSVDTQKPILVLPDLPIYTNRNPFLLEINLIESNFQEAIVQSQSITSLVEGKVKAYLNLTEGMNTISVLVIDKAGNESETEISILLDVTNPDFTLLTPAPWMKSIRKTILLSGTVEKEAVLTVNEMVIPNDSGSFRINYTLKPGVNTLAFLAIDRAGNTKKYIVPVTYYPNFFAVMVIGKKTADTSFGTVDLPDAPFLYDSTFMVPLRLFVELLGFTVEFEPVFQMITIRDDTGKEIITQIGNTVYTVNGEKKSLPVPPVIKNGRTFVPIRLFAEEFGFQVLYQQKPPSVRLTFYEN